MANSEEEKLLMGKRIKERREALKKQRAGFTQADVAEKLAQTAGKNVSREAYSHYELGHNEVAATDLPHLAKVLECSINYFYSDVPSSLTEDDEAIKYYKKMPEILKPAAYAVLKALYDAGVSK